MTSGCRNIASIKLSECASNAIDLHVLLKGFRIGKKNKYCFLYFLKLMEGVFPFRKHFIICTDDCSDREGANFV